MTLFVNGNPTKTVKLPTGLISIAPDPYIPFLTLDIPKMSPTEMTDSLFNKTRGCKRCGSHFTISGLISLKKETCLKGEKHIFEERTIFVYPSSITKDVLKGSSPYVLRVETERKLERFKLKNKFQLPRETLERCDKIARFAFDSSILSEGWIPRDLPNGLFKNAYDGMSFTDTVLDDMSYEMAHPFEPFIIVKI